MEESKRKGLGARVWGSILLVGIIGQLAWAIENQYINLWVYSQSGDATHINWMTNASAIVAAVTTFFVGAFSDRTGKRKIIIPKRAMTAKSIRKILLAREILSFF